MKTYKIHYTAHNDRYNVTIRRENGTVATTTTGFETLADAQEFAADEVAK